MFEDLNPGERLFLAVALSVPAGALALIFTAIVSAVRLNGGI